MTDTQLTQMYYGQVPDGYQVHHKMPREFGGGNEFDNLMLIRTSNGPNLHTQLTEVQNRVSEGMTVGQSRTVEFPMFEGKYFVNERGTL